MLGPYLIMLLIIYMLTALTRDIIEDFIDSQSKSPLILRVLYFIPKLIPLIIIGGFFILTILKRQI